MATMQRCALVAVSVPELGMTLGEIRWTLPFLQAEVMATQKQDPLLLLAMTFAVATDYQRGIA